MNLKNLIKNLLKTEDNEGLQSVEKRMQFRYPICNSKIAILQVDGIDFKIFDVGYSGLGILMEEKSAYKHSFSKDRYFEAKLTLFGQSIVVNIRCSFVDSKRAGFCLAHNSQDCLLFLREPIELMRRGYEMAKINKEFLKNEQNIAGWSYFHGNIADDLRLRESPDSHRLEEALLSILYDDHYEEIVWFQGKFTTRHAKNALACGIQAEQTQNLNQDYMRRGLCILLGAKAAYPEEKGIEEFSQKCLDYWLELTK